MVEIMHEGHMIHVPVNDVTRSEYNDWEGEIPDGISYDVVYTHDGDVYARTSLDDDRTVRMKYTDSGWEAEEIPDSSDKHQPGDILWTRGEREQKPESNS